MIGRFAFCLIFSALAVNSVNLYAAEEPLFFSAEISSEAEDADNAAGLASVPAATGVTEEMCKSSYWIDKTQGTLLDPKESLISIAGIEELNKEMLSSEGTYLNDLENFSESYNPEKLRDSLKNISVPDREIYVDKKLLSDNKVYYEAIGQAIYDTAYTGETKDNQYAVAVKRTTILNIPVKSYIGYSATDGDNENVNSALNINEPFIIRQKAEVDGDLFYWGYSDNCTGWVLSDDLAICKDKAEWLDAWKTDPENKDFIVVTENAITLEPSYYTEYLSEVKLTFATILKLVPDDEIPSSVGERGTWNNYVVYLPTRNAEGKYEKKCALISQHYEVNIGYLKMTEEEILRVAFNNLGDRYGWGGMLDSMDCSLYTRNIYKCFGLSLPRNTSWQRSVEGRAFDLAGMSDEEKLAAMKRMPAGTLFYFPGHAMMYVGTDNDMAYVISDTGSLSDSEGELNVRTMYSIILNPLTVRRRNGNTWLQNIEVAILPISKDNYDYVLKNIETGAGPEPETPSENVVRKVDAVSGQTYGSSTDTLPLDTFLGSIKGLFISFANVEGAGVESLNATCIRGSVITVKEEVESIACDKKVAKVKKDRKSGSYSIKLKSSGTVTFNLAGGKQYSVAFTVDKPKPQKDKVRELIGSSRGKSVSLNAAQLFGTTIDSGKLTLLRDKAGNARIEDNVLYLTSPEKSNFRVCYSYLNKKYKLTVK